MWEVPEEVWLTSGHGKGGSRLNSFDGALFSAGIGNLNLVKVTSILPARAKIVQICAGERQVQIPPGCLVPTVYSTISSNIPGQRIACGLVLVVPADRNVNGVIFEASMVGSAEQVAVVLDDMAEEAAALRGLRGFETVKAVRECTVEIRVASVVAAALMIPRSMQREPQFD